MSALTTMSDQGDPNQPPPAGPPPGPPGPPISTAVTFAEGTVAQQRPVPPANSPSSTASALERINEEAQGLEEDIETTIQIARNLAETSTTFGANIAPSDNKPAVPTIGGLTALSKDEWSAWTGGKPKADWSGLEDHTVDSTSPNQLRPIYVSAAQKGYNYRRTGLKDTFKPTNDLIAFQNSVWNHLTDTGMDSIAYLKDPLDATKMTNVVKAHARYTVQSAKALIEDQVPKYDKYDRTNDKAARTFLLASLQIDLSNKVAEKLDDDDPFPIVWLQFLKAIQSTSIERFEDLKATIKARLPSQYPGENLEQLAIHFRKDANELTTAGQYDHNLTLTMMKTFLLAGGTGNEDFRFPLRSVKQKLEQALLDIGFKDKDAANKHMSDNKLTYKDVCTHAEDAYRTLFDRKEWPPARHARDSKAPPASFNLADAMPMTRSEVMLLMQSKSPSGNKGAPSAKTGNCHKCGKPGHWSRECPNGDATNGSDNGGGSGGRPARNGNGGRSNGDRAGRGAPNGNGNRPAASVGNPTSWKTVAPQPGAPITKQHNNRTFNWCLKCKRWTTTHVTATHTGGKATNTNAAPDNRPSVNFSLVQDPSVWSTAVANSPSVSDFWFGMRTAIGALFPLSWLVLWLLARAIAPHLLDCMQVVGSVVKASAVAAASTFALLQAIDWNHVALQVSEVALQVVGFVVAHHQELLAPLLWLILLMAPFWVKAPPPPASDKDPALFQSRNQRRATMKAQARQRRYIFEPRRNLSIRSAGLHRSYPLRLRSQGHFIGPQAPTVNHQDHCRQLAELRHQVMQLTTQVARLQQGGRPPRQNVCQRHELSIADPIASPLIRRRARSCPKSKRSYQPVVASGLRANGATHGFGNQKWTDRQMNAAFKIAFHVKMATVPMNANPTILRMALQAPGRFRDSLPSSTYSVIWDSGASISISPDKNDFIGPLESPGAITQLKGIAKGLRIEGFGHVMWAINDSSGNLRMVKVPAYFAPKVRVRLLSTTSLLQTYPDESIKIESDQLVLSGVPGDLTRGELVALINPQNNLPTSEAHSFKDTPIAVEALNVAISTVNTSNINLSEPEKELLRWHYRLGHMNFRKIQFLMRTGILSKSEASRRLHTASCKIVTPPKCAACQYGKQHQRPVPGKTASVVKDRAGVLRDGDLLPGQQISMDHFICKTKGRLFTSAGKSLRQDMFSGGCLFIDHASSFVHVEFQVHLNTAESLEAKDKFERMCRDVGVVPQAYLSDNGGSFTSAEYSKKVAASEQALRFAGVGAHHQNGNAERAIQTIMSVARTMMLHAAIHWPDVADTALWPMAVAHAVFLHNHVPNPTTGLAPGDVFTKSRWEQRKFHDVHVWGCPVYVLDSKISGGMKLPRWTPRSVRCINVGLSSNHASTVPLVLNPTSGYITAQFHIVFDDWFATIATDVDAFPNFMSDEWYRMFGDSHYQYPFDEDDLATERDETDDRGTIEHERGETNRSTVSTAMDVHAPTVPLSVTPLSISQFYPSPPPGHLLTPTMSSRREELSYQAPSNRLQNLSRWEPPYGTPYAPMSPPREPEEQEAVKTPMSPVPMQELPRRASPMLPTREPVPSPHKTPTAPLPLQVPPSASVPTPPSSAPSPAPVSRRSVVSPVRRSTRQRNAPSRLGYGGDQGRGYIAEPSAWIFAENGLLPPPCAYKVATTDPDTLTYDQAMADTCKRFEMARCCCKRNIES